MKPLGANQVNEEFDSLVQQVEERRDYLGDLLRRLRSTKNGSTWDPVALARVLQATTGVLSMPADVRAAIAKAQEVAERAASVAILELESNIRDLCQSRKWRVDGQWPSLIIASAVDLKVDAEVPAVVVSGRKLNSTTIREIERTLEEHVSQLIPRGFDPKNFLAEVAYAYDQAAGGKGGEVPLLEVYRTLVIRAQTGRFWRDARRSGFSEITSDQFRARMSATLDANVTAAPDGRELRLLPPINPKDALFLYQPAENRFGFVGRIEFRGLRR